MSDDRAGITHPAQHPLPGTYIATGEHRSAYPNPITFSKGAPLTIGDKYQGPEDWNDWYFCTTPGHPGGWVPDQIIERLADAGAGIALEGYTARELDVDAGDVLTVAKVTNGWMWCKRLSDNQSGWVPMALLRMPDADQA